MIQHWPGCFADDHFVKELMTKARHGRGTASRIDRYEPR